MSVKNNQLIAPKAPRLPAPGDEYSAESADQFQKALNAYFTQNDATQAALLGPTGARFLDFPYGMASTNASVTFSNTTDAFAIGLTEYIEGSGTALNASFLTRFYMQHAGLWQVTYTLQFDNSSGAARDVTLWIAKSGTAVNSSAHIVTVPVGKYVHTFNATFQAAQNEYVELYAKTSHTGVILYYSAAAAPVPAIPAVTAALHFMSAVNTDVTGNVFIPPAPPAPAPTPTPPPPTGAPNPSPPPAPAPDPGQDSDIQEIFDALGPGERAWWYPNEEDDRYEFADGTGTNPFTLSGTGTAPYGRLADHSDNGFHLRWTDINARPNNYPVGDLRALGLYSHPETVGLGGSTHTGFTMAFAIRFDSGTYNTVFADYTGAATSSTNGMFLRFSSGVLTFSVGNGVNRTEVAQTGIIDGASAAHNVIIVWYDTSANTINLKVNDNPTASASCPTISAGSSAMQLFSLPFADFSLGGWEGWDQLYGLCFGGIVLKGTTLGETDRNHLRYWLGRQCGVVLAGSTSAPAPTPAPPAPTPAPPPSTTPPTIENLSRHPKDLLKIGDFFIEDNRWNAAAAGITEGDDPWEFKQRVERYLTTGDNGEIAWEVDWYWPRYRQNGTEYDHIGREVKCFPCSIYGRRPGYYSPSPWVAWDFAVRLPDGVVVPAASTGAPAPIAADWTPSGGSVSTVAPSGSSGGVLPLPLPLQTMWAQCRAQHRTTPQGVGHLVFDMWLTETGTQQEGFASSAITHEIMVPLMIWGNYGATHTEGGTWSKDVNNYSHDAVIGGVTYKVYVWQNKGTNPVTGVNDRFPPASSYPGVQYNFSPGTLNGSFTNEETGAGRIGWKFIVYEAQNIASQGHPSQNGLMTVDIAGILNDVRSRSDSRGVRWCRGTEYLASVELGCEIVYGQGNLVVWDQLISGSALPPAPTPSPAPGGGVPPPAPATAPFYPFGSRLDLDWTNSSAPKYPFGIMPQMAKADMDLAVIACYNKWKQAMLRKAPTFVANSISIYGAATITDGWYIDKGAGLGTGTVSEGMGYGMLILVIMAGYDPDAQSRFNGLLRVARGRPAYGMGEPYLMAWTLNGDMSSPDGWPAADGDLDIACALLMAHRQWGSGGANPNYLGEAINTINALKNRIFHADGDPRYGQYNGTTRTSDHMAGMFRSFREATGDTFWDTARTRCATLLNAITNTYSPGARLQPDFIVNLNSGLGNPAQPFTMDAWNPFTGIYGPNACRNPWRFGTDYIWSGDSTWGNLASDITTTIKNLCGGNPFNSGDYVTLDGSLVRSSRYFSREIQGPVMVGAMCNAAHQTYLNTLFNAHANNFSTGYYEAELQLIPLLVASGNWWRPEGP